MNLRPHVRLQLQRILQVFFRGGFFSKNRIDKPAVRKCFRVFRVDFNGFAEIYNGLLVFAQIAVDRPAIVECIGVFGIEFNGRAGVRNRLFLAAYSRVIIRQVGKDCARKFIPIPELDGAGRLSADSFHP